MIKLFRLENIVLHYFCPKSLAKMLSGMNWRTSKTLIDSNSSVRMISIQPHQRMKWFYNKVLSSREWANGNIKRFLLIIPSSNWTRLFLLFHLLSRKGFIHFQIYWYPLEAIVSRNVVQSWYYNWYLTMAEICFFIHKSDWRIYWKWLWTRHRMLLGIVSTSMGFFVDIWGRQKVVSLASFGGFFFSFLSGFVTNTYLVILFRFLSGAM